MAKLVIEGAKLMYRTQRRFIAMVTLALAVTACGSDGNDAAGTPNGDTASSDISGSVKEWAVAVDATSAPAGDISFTIDNDGTTGHEFLIVKTDIAPGEIPVDGDHFPEDADGIEVIDEIGEFAKGTTETLDVTLEAGSYQLVCNLPSHYANGMFTGFEVVG
jgi:uncharacterized cupredoxin-like copper-binding protein